MLRNGFFSLLSTGVRVLSSAVLFIVMAHAWGPEKFGVFMYPFTVAAILVKLVDYGFALQLMRDIGHAPAQARHITGHAFAAKLLLTLPTILIAAMVAASLPHEDSYILLFGLLLCDALINSFALFLNTPLRALGRFDVETYVIAGANVALFSVVVGAIASGAGPVLAAVGFVLVRLGYLIASWKSCELVLETRLRPEWAYESLMRTLKVGFPFAVHVTVGTLGMYIETIMVQHYLGASAVGLYQAGMRVLFGALLVADSLNNVYLEALARVHRHGAELERLGTRMTRHLLALGVLALLCTLGGSEWIVRILYGHRYDELIPILPLFGLLVLVRYGGTPYGTILTLADKQFVRAIAVIGMVILGVAINMMLIPLFGLVGAICAAICSHVALYSVYVVATWRDHRTAFVDWRSKVLITVAGLALLFALFPIGAGPSLRIQTGALLAVATAILGVTRAEWDTLSRRVARAR